MTKPIDTSGVVSIDLAMGEETFLLFLGPFLFFGIAIVCVFAAIYSIGDPGGSALGCLALALIFCLLGAPSYLSYLRRRQLCKNALLIRPDGIRETFKIQGFVPWRAVSRVEWHITTDNAEYYGLPSIYLHILPEYKDQLLVGCPFYDGSRLLLPLYEYEIEYRQLYEICLAYFEQAQHKNATSDVTNRPA
jgi:hypothetical protein